MCVMLMVGLRNLARTARWLVAGLAAAAVFTGSAWICGMFLLPPVVASADVRWLLSVGLGSALAAVVALWGNWWATREDMPARMDGSGRPKTAEASGERSIAAGGDIKIASTGDNATNIEGR